MWGLTEVLSDDDHGEPRKFIFTEVKSYTVGRKECDIVVSRLSVSRKHATIVIEPPSPDKNRSAELFVEDHSKVGSFVNSSKITKRTALKKGDEIAFGGEDRFVVELQPLIVCSSGMRSGDRSAAVANVLKIGGKSTELLEECTHLLMNEFALTAKGLMALIHGKTIVTPQYIEGLLSRKTPQDPLPSIEKYQPPIKDASLQSGSLLPNARRRNLFESCNFVFFAQNQYDKVASVIKTAKGDAQLYDHIQKKLPALSRNNEIFIVQPHSPNADVEKKHRHAEEYGVTVAENEIGNAIVLMNRDRWPKKQKQTIATSPSKQKNLVTEEPEPAAPDKATKTPSVESMSASTLPKPQSIPQPKKRTANDAFESATEKNQTSPRSTDTMTAQKTSNTNPSSPKKQHNGLIATATAATPQAASSPKKPKIQSAPPVPKPMSIAAKRASLDSAPIVRPTTPVPGRTNFKKFRKSEEGRMISPIKPIACVAPEEIVPMKEDRSSASPTEEKQNAPSSPPSQSFVAKALADIAHEEQDRKQMHDLFQSNVFSVTKLVRKKT